jgi:hypothetical protein
MEYINRSQIHEYRNWERQGRAVSFLGMHKSDLVCSAYSMLCCHYHLVRKRKCYLFFVTRQMEALTREYLNIKTGFADNK